uniref:Apolipoprotein L n=1 Tax=Labrus bergylta TaxID=56723 RepID=A0A3Q3G2M1_9LABR
MELEKLHCFLDAVEKLAVTSLHVFVEGRQVVLHLPEGVGLDHVQVVIAAARLVCPLLVEFKRDEMVFFQPKLQNVEVLAYQMNQHFSLVYLFHDCFGFLDEFRDCLPRLLQSLDGLEEIAVQLDSMNKGAKISSVVGSSVGAVGGVLSIIGLALAPVTAGVSLALTMTGIGLSITNGVNNLVTTATELGVNTTQRNKAAKVFKGFMKDLQSLQDCLKKVSDQTVARMKASQIDVVLGVGKVLVKALRSAKGSNQRASALTKSVRAGLIGLNALFLGMDVFYICKYSISLSKGSETEASQFIRARAALWRSEIDAWQKIYDSLIEGLQKSEKNKAILEMPFHPELESELKMETKKKNKRKWKFPLMKRRKTWKRKEEKCVIQ